MAGLGTWQGWGHRYLLQQQGVPVVLGQVVGGKRALDAGPDDDGVVGGLVGLAGGSHVRPRPRPRPHRQPGAEPRGGTGQSPAKPSGWRSLGRPPAPAGMVGARGGHILPPPRGWPGWSIPIPPPMPAPGPTAKGSSSGSNGTAGSTGGVRAPPSPAASAPLPVDIFIPSWHTAHSTQHTAHGTWHPPLALAPARNRDHQNQPPNPAPQGTTEHCTPPSPSPPTAAGPPGPTAPPARSERVGGISVMENCFQ